MANFLTKFSVHTQTFTKGRVKTLCGASAVVVLLVRHGLPPRAAHAPMRFSFFMPVKRAPSLAAMTALFLYIWVGSESGRVLVLVRSGATGVVSVTETCRVWPLRLLPCAGVEWSPVLCPYTPEAL